jgi:hypothetical protein
MRSCSWTLPSPPSSRSRAASFARAVVPPGPQLPAAPLRALALSWALPEGWHNARPRAACGATLPRRGAAFLQLDRVRPLPVLCPSPASAPRLHHRESVAACTRLPRARVGLCFFCAPAYYLSPLSGPQLDRLPAARSRSSPQVLAVGRQASPLPAIRPVSAPGRRKDRPLPLTFQLCLPLRRASVSWEYSAKEKPQELMITGDRQQTRDQKGRGHLSY